MSILGILNEIKRLNFTSRSMTEGQKKSFWEEFNALRDKQEAKASRNVAGFSIGIDGRIYVDVCRRGDGIITCVMQSHRQKIFSNDPFPMQAQEQAAKFFNELEQQIPYS